MIDLSEKFDKKRQSKSLVSVIIPAYNAAGYISNAITSAAAQTHGNLEIIAINDGSADDTLNVLRQLSCIEPRLRIIDQPNGGVSAARNNAIRVAKGDFIAFLDSDDRWNPKKLEQQLARLAAEAPDGNVVSMTAFTLCYPDGRIEENPHPGNPPMFETVIQRGFYIMPSSWVIPKKLFDDDHVGLFDEQLNYGEDADWILRALKSGAKPLIESEGLTFYAVPEPSKRYKNQLENIGILIDRHKDWVCENYSSCITRSFLDMVIDRHKDWLRKNYPSCITSAFLDAMETLRTEDHNVGQTMGEFGMKNAKAAAVPPSVPVVR